MDNVKFEDTTTCNSCGSLHTSATVFINSVVHHQVQRVRNHYFSSAAWETIILIPTSEKPLLSYEINWLVFEYLSLHRSWFHVRCMRHLLIGRKKKMQLSCDLKTIEMLWIVSPGKPPDVVHHWLPVFLRMSRNGKRAKFNLFFDFLFF